MEGFIVKIKNVIINTSKELKETINNLVITDVSKLKSATFNQTLMIEGIGVIKSITVFVSANTTASLKLIVDDKETTLRVGEQGLYQNHIGGTLVFNLNTPILFNSKFELKGGNGIYKGNILYTLE